VWLTKNCVIGSSGQSFIKKRSTLFINKKNCWRFHTSILKLTFYS
jgi:hypothetical protein